MLEYLPECKTYLHDAPQSPAFHHLFKRGKKSTKIFEVNSLQKTSKIETGWQENQRQFGSTGAAGVGNIFCDGALPASTGKCWQHSCSQRRLCCCCIALSAQHSLALECRCSSPSHRLSRFLLSFTSNSLSTSPHHAHQRRRQQGRSGVRLAEVLRPVRLRRHPQLRHHPHRADAARSGEVPHPGGPGQVQEHRQWLQGDHGGGGPARPGSRLGSDRHRLLAAGPGQVRLLRALQDHVQQCDRRREHLPLPNVALPGRLRLCGVLRRHCPLPAGGVQGAGADAARLLAAAARRRAADLPLGGPLGLLQGPGAAVDAPDSLHDDEVRLLRAHRGAAVQARGAEAARPVQQGGAADGDLRRRLHRRRLLRRRLAPRRHRGLEAEPGQGQHRRTGAQEAGTGWRVEGPHSAYHHDRHADRPAMVHLRRRQGVPEPAAPAAAGDARESEEEARGGAAEELDGKSLPVWFLSTNSFSVCPVSNDSSTLVVVLFSFSVVILILFLIPLLEHTPHYPSLLSPTLANGQFFQFIITSPSSSPGR